VDERVVEDREGPVVPAQVRLEEGVVGRVLAADARQRDPPVGALRRRERGVDAVDGEGAGDAGQEVLEEGDRGHRGDRRRRVAVVDKLADGVVPVLARARVADVVEVHHVALRQQVARVAPDEARLER
jgi:hypothetical protein